jgi:hypothetical protein
MDKEPFITPSGTIDFDYFWTALGSDDEEICKKAQQFLADVISESICNNIEFASPELIADVEMHMCKDPEIIDLIMNPKKDSK